MSTWPSTLPQFFHFDSYVEEGADNLITSQMSVGPAKVRRRSTAGPRPMRGSFYLTTSQVAVLRSFIRTETADRALAFTFPNQLGGTALLVRMTNPLRVSTMGLGWRADLELEILP